MLLDPWTDAATIAARLNSPCARLVLVIGAEGWCETCRTFRPTFESLALQAGHESEVWLWLDLEEHAEFMEEFIPDSLPLVLSYKGEHLTHAVVPDRLNVLAIADLLALPSRIDQAHVPNMRARLMTADWAS